MVQYSIVKYTINRDFIILLLCLFPKISHPPFTQGQVCHCLTSIHHQNIHVFSWSQARGEQPIDLKCYIGIERFPVQAPLGNQSGLLTQACCEAPNNLTFSQGFGREKLSSKSLVQLIKSVVRSGNKSLVAIVLMIKQVFSKFLKIPKKLVLKKSNPLNLFKNLICLHCFREKVVKSSLENSRLNKNTQQNKSGNSGSLKTLS